MLDNLPAFTSAKPCPRCSELLHWSENEKPPRVEYDTRTGRVLYVELMRFCISCGYREDGYLNIGKDPVWTARKED
jgi:C4-type Zn-finger protein